MGEVLKKDPPIVRRLSFSSGSIWTKAKPIRAERELPVKSILLAVAFFFLLNFIPVVAAKTVADEVKITGYREGIYSLTDAMERKLDESVIAPLSKQRSMMGSQGQIKILVIGSADQIGKSTSNDDLARKRAEEVKAVLSLKFPEAAIVVRTKGDQLNIKMVVVRWEISPLAPPKSPTAPKQSTHRQAGMWAVLLLGAMVAGSSPFILSRIRGKEVKQVTAIWEKDKKVYLVSVMKKAAHTTCPLSPKKIQTGSYIGRVGTKRNRRSRAA